MDNSEHYINPEEIPKNEINDKIIQNQDNNNHIEENNSVSKIIQLGHELSSEDNKKYFLLFSPQKDLLKIILKEKYIFPYKTFELLISLDELKPKNDFFCQYSSIQDLSSELNNPNTTIGFKLIKESANIIGLIFIFPDEEEQVELTAAPINDRELFRQLFEKYKSIKQEQDEDIIQLKSRINQIEEILVNTQKEQEAQREKERLEKERLEKEKEEEEKKENEENTNENNNNEVQEIKKSHVSEVKSSKKTSKISIKKDKEKKIKNDKIEKNNEKGKNNKKKVK